MREVQVKEGRKRKQTEDWIEHIIYRIHENYRGREIVIWGSYGVSDCIKDGLKEKYGINTAFYVDSDTAKIDEKKVFSPDCLSGRADKYYVVIPIAYYSSISEKLIGGVFTERRLLLF